MRTVAENIWKITDIEAKNVKEYKNIEFISELKKIDTMDSKVFAENYQLGVNHLKFAISTACDNDIYDKMESVSLIYQSLSEPSVAPAGEQ